jgi:pimeloyl-ACP methyl ester carboxylesterase
VSGSDRVATSKGVVRHRYVEVSGLEIFYREAGRAGAPTLLLLHGFPSASHQYRRLIDGLAERYHLVAPDYPGFGHSELPVPSVDRPVNFTFDWLAETVEAFIDAIGLRAFFVYMFDYGAPVGFRIAMQHPEWIIGMISQNGNAYEVGLGPGAERLRAGKFDPEAARRGLLDVSVTRSKYLDGAHEPELVSPDGWVLDQYFLEQAGRAEFQVQLLADYPTNIALYESWQAWIRERQPPLLVAWGANDAIFIEPGAWAYKNDVPDAEVHLLDAGHFALDEYLDEYAKLISNFIDRHTSA